MNRRAEEIGADLVRRLQAGQELSSMQVADDYGVQRAAAKRYLDAVVCVFPGRLEVTGRRPVRYRWRPETPAAPMAVMALAMARAALPGLRGSQLDVHLEEAIAEAQSRLADERPPADLGRLFVPRNRLGLEPGDKADDVDRLVTAIWHCRKVRFEFQHFGPLEADTCLVHPLSLVPTDEGLFCLAFVEDSARATHLKTRRMYKVARMSRVRLLPDTFAYPAPHDFDPAREFEHCYGLFMPSATEPDRVVLQFAPDWAGYLAFEKVHRSQTAPQVLADGWIEVRLDVYVTLDLVQYLRGLGDEVRIVGPRRLRAWVESRKGLEFLAAGAQGEV